MHNDCDNDQWYDMSDDSPLQLFPREYARMLFVYHVLLHQLVVVFAHQEKEEYSTSFS